MFNIATVALGLLFVEQLGRLAVWTSAGANVARQIPNAHVLFNVLGGLLILASRHGSRHS